MTFPEKVFCSGGKYYTRLVAVPDGMFVAEYQLVNEGFCEHHTASIVDAVDVPKPKSAQKPGVNADYLD